jgi:glutaredoxin-like protein NrdH
MHNAKHKVKAYTLSTCGWCKKTKALLNALSIEYEYVDVDTLSGEERDRVKQEVSKYNPLISFPTLVIDDGKEVIVGFKEDEITKCLG